MGIPADLAYEVENRPFFVTEDGRGRVIQALFAYTLAMARGVERRNANEAVCVSIAPRR